jgi:ribonuclease HIII
MGRKNRLKLIAQIEKERNSKVLCFLTGDRRGYETRIHPEVHTMMYNHLQHFGEVDKIDLFLYSTGGVTMAAWSIVNLIREFCKTFSVIVPFKAFSTATLICLGADEIIMGKLGQLGPVDPSVTMPFNPQAPGVGGSAGRLLPISVEEVRSFIDFAKDKNFCGLSNEDTLKDVLGQLTNKVHPLSLGSVYRAIEQIKMISTKLLKFHMTQKKDESKIKKIVGDLTKNLYSHDYIISRKEAKNEIKLKITNAESIKTRFDGLIYDLFKDYEKEMCLTNNFNPDVFLGKKNKGIETFYRAFLESKSRADSFITKNEFNRTEQIIPPATIPQTVFAARTIREGWEQI